ncbi:MAG TPA: CHAT domain-containing protein [Amycolatopsis sp.]|nr:CHAT domain-containing protein [Amycolatopsis sp.]
MDFVRSVVEDFEQSGDIGALLTAELPPPWQCPQHLLPDLAKAHWLRYRAQGGFDGLVDREFWASIRGEQPDPAVRAVIASPEYARLAQARDDFGIRRDVPSLIRFSNAYTTLQNALDDDRLKAALTVDQCELLELLDEHEGTNANVGHVLNGLEWVVVHTPPDDPQRARRLLARARARSRAGRRPGRVLADYRAAAQLALRERPVWQDILVELAQYEADLYSGGAAPIHLAGALVTCRDLAEALRRDYGRSATVPVLAQLEKEVSERIGPDLARFLRDCHRDRRLLRAHRKELDELLRRDLAPGVLVARRDQAWLLALGLPLDHEDRFDALLDLYGTNVDLWEIGGDDEAVGLACDAVSEAQMTTTPDDRGRTRLLKAAAHAASMASVQTRSVDDVQAAVDAARELVKLPSPDDEERALRLATLASALVRQFEMDANPAAGQEAITVAEEAIALTPPDDPNLPLRWSTLSGAAQRVAEKSLVGEDDESLFAKSVEAGAKAVATMPVTDARRVGMLYNYANAVERQAVVLEATDPEPFEEAERAYRAALALLPPGHADHPRIESTIAGLLYHRFDQCGDLEALDDSLDLGEKAVRETPREHHWWPVRAYLLARSARELAKFGGPRADELRELAIAHYRAVGEHPSASAQYRLDSEQAQAELLAEADPVTWLAAQERVIEAIPASVSRALPRLRRMRAVRQIDGLADRVADAGVRSGQLDRAVELLERCRGVLFGDAWGVRRGWARLREVRPDLAEKLSQVEKDLTDADAYSEFTFTIEVKYQGKSSSEDWDPRPQAVERIRRLAARRDGLVEEARSVPGFEDLLRPPELALLRERLHGHTVVIVSATGTAFIVPGEYTEPVAAVPLRQLSEVTARAQVAKLRAALADVKNPACSFDRREQAQLDVHDVLEWLWDTTAGPVLERVTGKRVWWCPVGATTGLPLHAAGRHREAGGQTVFDRVVSSYTPSLTALADTVATARPRHARPTALVVGVGTSERGAVLANVRTEAEEVAAMLPGSTVLLDAAASAEAIKDGLHEHAIAHLACHGRAVTSSRHPDLGGLMLSDGMFVPSLLRDLRTTQAQLAFLSACDTASADAHLLDEPLNLASAFHLAGFRGVIGTLWHTADSAETARAVYAELTANGTRPADPADAATALTATLRRTRDDYPAVPSRWAAHIHVGD